MAPGREYGRITDDEYEPERTSADPGGDQPERDREPAFQALHSVLRFYHGRVNDRIDEAARRGDRR